MEGLPSILVIDSTFMHVAWNVLIRRKAGVGACIITVGLLLVHMFEH